MKITNLYTLACVPITIMWACKKEKVADVEKLPLNDHGTAFVHAGLLHKQSGFDRM